MKKGWFPEYNTIVENPAYIVPALPVSRSDFFRALAVAESALNPNDIYMEPTGHNSIGLFALSLVDVKNYGGQSLDIDTEDDLRDPIKNIKLAMLIMHTLTQKHPKENIWRVAGRYWSTLRRETEWPGVNQKGYKRFLDALPRSREPRWLHIARAELGQKEVIGSKHNNRILEYQSSTALAPSDDETPWSSSFVNWCITKSGLLGTGSVRSASWMRWGVPAAVPTDGAIVVFAGYVGFFVGVDKDDVRVLGGDQNDAVSIASRPKSKVLGYRVPG